MHLTLRRMAVLGTLCVAFSWAVPALGGPVDKLIKKAEVRFRLADFKGALQLYQKAFSVKPDPELHFHIGQCHRYLKDYDRALFHYRRYLDEVKNPEKKEETEHLIRLSEEALAPASQKTHTEPVVIPARTGPARTPTDEAAPGRTRSLLLWTGVGVTAALLLTGTITMSVSHGKSEEFKDLSTPKEDLQDLKDTGESLRTAGLVTFILGAVTGAATTVYFFFGKPAEQGAAAVAPVPGGGVLVVSGSF